MKFATIALAFVIFAGFAALRSTQRIALPDIAVRTQSTESRNELPLSTGNDRQLRIPVGPPDAMLAVWTLEPAKGTPIRGTILLLHGFLTSHLQVTRRATMLQQHGYRAVMVDLRGFGESLSETSKRDPITFGALDARDMKQLVDKLQELKLCGPTLGVYGTSYGAATSILYAGLDPRVTAVVAVAPFADIREEVPSFSRGALGNLPSMVTDEHLQTLANMLSRVANLDFDSAKPLEAITRTKAPVLLIHSPADDYIPYNASVRLQAAAPDHATLMTLPNKGHIETCFDWFDTLHEPTLKWFEENLK